ncbi:unnamed protein product [Ilex paraguariensis]|uniref:Transmembrane protein n=1 Tax=Ilex paraguariensis TaxID=185542 RepID=A0ABC8RCN7_9AQUA
MASSSLPSFCSLSKPFCKSKAQKYPRVRSESFRNEGNSANIVDANLSVLRERIEQVRKKERIDTRRCIPQNGWTYKPVYDHDKHKRDSLLSESIKLVGYVGSAFGLVFLSGSLCVFIVSFAVHLHT